MIREGKGANPVTIDKMTLFRCPYCKKNFEDISSNHCPHCGKDMVIPGHLRKTTLKDRKRMREKIYRNAERQRKAILNNDINPGQNPVIIGLMIMTLVVLGGLLLGRVNMASKHTGRTSQELRAERELRALRIALERFKLDCGRYPTKEEGLKSLVINPGITNWGGHYVTIVRPDPWHTPYVYAQTNNSVILFSAGLDKCNKTADDIIAEVPVEDEIKRKNR